MKSQALGFGVPSYLHCSLSLADDCSLDLHVQDPPKTNLINETVLFFFHQQITRKTQKAFCFQDRTELLFMLSQTSLDAEQSCCGLLGHWLGFKASFSLKQCSPTYPTSHHVML